jgi:cytochrome P450
MFGEHRVTEWYGVPSFTRLLGRSADASVQASKERHGRRRRQQATAFTPDALAGYAPRVEAATRSALARWAAATGEAGGVDLYAALNVLTFDYAAATVVDLGLTREARAEVLAHWTAFTTSLFSLPIDAPGFPLRRGLRAKARVVAALGDAVEAYRQAARKETPSTMLGHYVAARAADGDPVDAEELVDTTLGLLLAGHETSHSAHVALLGLLPALGADVRAALEAEQAAVVAAHGDLLTPAALAAMPVADAVSKECLRILGPAEGLFRRATADFALSGRRVAAGDVLYVSNLYAKASDPGLGGIKGGVLPPAHMDANAAAASVRPDRWLGGPDPAPSADSFGLAFGLGRHACLGAPLYAMEAKALLAVVVREYDVAIVSATAWSPSWAAQGSRFRAGKAGIKIAFARRAAPLVAGGGGGAVGAAAPAGAAA